MVPVLRKIGVHVGLYGNHDFGESYFQVHDINSLLKPEPIFNEFFKTTHAMQRLKSTLEINYGSICHKIEGNPIPSLFSKTRIKHRNGDRCNCRLCRPSRSKVWSF